MLDSVLEIMLVNIHKCTVFQLPRKLAPADSVLAHDRQKTAVYAWVNGVFRSSTTVSRISLMESCMCGHCHWCGGPPWLADPLRLADDNVMDGWGARPLR